MPPAPGDRDDTDQFELRLFLEEICCNLCRFRHVRNDGVPPQQVRIDQEVYLGAPGSFADIRVQAPPAVPPYFVEVKWGYSPERVVHTLARKYGKDCPATVAGDRLILLYDVDRISNWNDVEPKIRAALRPGLTLEVWDERRLLDLLREQFGVSIDEIGAADLLDVREAIDRAKGGHAFGPEYTGSMLATSLLWHLGFWRVHDLRQRLQRASADGRSFNTRAILPPAMYHDVAVLMADLAGFSSYVRDTRDERVVRDCLTAFYAKSRHQIINAGGMLYQFLGDAVIALFGLPDRPDGYLRDALECAKALSDIGDSVSNEWQRQIDRVQTSGGVHIGMAIGDLQVMSLRPFSRAHMGCVGDSINMAARLQSCAGSGEVVVSNMLYQRLEPSLQSNFTALDTIEAKNVGRIKAWKLVLNDRART